MKSFQKVLCAVDFSESSTNVLRHAEELSRKYDSEIVILHVLDLPMPMMPGPVFEYDDYYDAVTERMRDFVAPLRIPFVTMLSSGSPGRKIATLAENLGATLIFMGTRGLKGVTHKLMGSTAEYVTRNSKVPVMTISPNCDPADNKKNKVLLAVGNLASLPQGLLRLRRTIRSIGSEVVPFHVIELTDPMFDSSFSANPFLMTIHATEDRKLQLSRMARKMLGFDKALEPVVAFGDAATEILKELERENYEYVILHPKKRTLLSVFFDSIVYQVISQSPVPVITFT